MEKVSADSSGSCGLALITGGARRLGAAICRRLHEAGHDIIVHCHRSRTEAENLVAELNAQRPDSAIAVSAALGSRAAAQSLFRQAAEWQPNGVRVLVNNASTYYPTPLATVSDDQWHDLRHSNLDAPLWLSQAFVQQKPLPPDGVVINLCDTMVPGGILRHAPYAAAKAGLANLTQSLARELAPDIRVNAVAPGSMLWPEPLPDADTQKAHLASIPLGRLGQPQDIANAVLFLINAPYITGQILSVDGGRGL